jgi:type IV secretory pathway VirD2 relaxase
VIVVHKYIAPKRNRGGLKAARGVAMGKALAHVKYIQHRPGEDREKGGREFFGESDDELEAKRVKKLVREMRDAKVTIHKLTLSPEINGYDKKALTRHVMKQLGDEKGLDLTWVAVVHENTEHEHIHVVVLGKDKNGRDVRINRNDHPKARAYGDQFLEREHPLEMERSRRLRSEKQKEKLSERSRERKDRIQRGVEVPFLKQKIIREVADPYE